MLDVAIIGSGTTAVGEHWDVSLRHLAWQAIEAALDDAVTTDIDAVFVGNMMAGTTSQQDHLGALIADYAGLRGVEAVAVEAAEASGAIAMRQAVLAVQSGQTRTALVVGVEKATDQTGSAGVAAQATGLDADYESIHGLTPTAVAGLLMRRYMHEYAVSVADFAPFSVNAHANAKGNPHAMFRNTLTAERFAAGPPVATPVSLFDAAPVADGAAAVIVTTRERALDMVPQPVWVVGSAVATDAFALQDRPDPLWLWAAAESTQRALAMADLTIDQIDTAELHDAAAIYAALSLEAWGVAERGHGWRIAADGQLGLNGRLPISTHGGLKARGNPLGATGVYQIAELVRQLRGRAGDCQVPHARLGLTQNLGGSGATAVTHILKASEM